MYDWNTVKIEVIFAPKTGQVKPWEIWGVFDKGRVHWASFKTEENANKRLEALNKKFTPEYKAKLNSICQRSANGK
jgi:hypothetical protein